MDLNKLNSKTITKINAFIENKQKMQQQISKKQSEIKQLEIEYELEEQAYVATLDDEALKRMKEIKQEIAGVEVDIKGLEDIVSKGNTMTLSLTNDDRQELGKAFKKISAERDKRFNEFVKKKAEVIVVYNKLKEEHEQVNDLYAEIIDLVDINFGRSEVRKMKAVIPNIQNGDIKEEVKDMFERCSNIKNNPDWL